MLLRVEPFRFLPDARVCASYSMCAAFTQSCSRCCQMLTGAALRASPNRTPYLLLTASWLSRVIAAMKVLMPPFLMRPAIYSVDRTGHTLASPPSDWRETKPVFYRTGFAWCRDSCLPYLPRRAGYLRGGHKTSALALYYRCTKISSARVG